MSGYQFKHNLKPGDIYKEKGRSARVEGVGVEGMYALVYYHKGDFRVVNNRPIFYTSNDLVIKVKMVHRCGTEVKYYHEGHPVIDRLLLHELKKMTNLSGDFNYLNIDKYVNLLETGYFNHNVKDGLYKHLAEYLDSLSKPRLISLRENIFREWGRVVGHEIVGVIEKVGSNVKNLREPLGYLSTWLKRVPEEYLNFKEGERVILQTRCARYKPAPDFLRRKGAAGVQLLGSEIEDVSRTLDGGYAQYIRVTPELIQSGCVIRVPDEISDVEAALIEPTACLIDCLDLATHPEGQDEQGNIMKKGVARGGTTAIIGSGAAAFIAAELALTFDEKIQVGGASRVVMFVRSREKAELGKRLFENRFGGKVEFFIYNSSLSPREVVRNLKERYGEDFFFDDVIIAAGDARTVELAHRIVSGTGWRIYTLAGTRGEVRIESGVWHYSNASTSGTSGCNTRAMENALKMIQRGTISLSKFSGKQYTFRDLLKDPGIFFMDKYLRPALLPNEDVPEVEWREL